MMILHGLVTALMLAGGRAPSLTFTWGEDDNRRSAHVVYTAGDTREAFVEKYTHAVYLSVVGFNPAGQPLPTTPMLTAFNGEVVLATHAANGVEVHVWNVRKLLLGNP